MVPFVGGVAIAGRWAMRSGLDVADDAGETFYRAMSRAELEGIQRTGGITPRGENFVTQNLPYVQQLAARHPGLFETTVRFDMAPGTRDALFEAGARSEGELLEKAGLTHLPLIRSGQTDAVHIKAEKEAITFGLRTNSAHVFNDRIRQFEELE